MRNALEEMFRRQTPAMDQSEAVYAKFKHLGANVNKMKTLGLATPQLEKLLGCFERLHDKKLVAFITGLEQRQLTEEQACREQSSKCAFKTCPRCRRDLTERNMLKDQYSYDFDAYVLICECGYVRQIGNSTNYTPRQSNLYEYPLRPAQQ
jgi:hypothetical protein